MVNYLARPSVVEVMKEAIKKMLRPHEVGLDESSLYSAIEHARSSGILGQTNSQTGNSEIIAKVLANELVVIQVYGDYEDGRIYSAPKTLILTPDQVKAAIEEHREKARFIKVFTNDKIICEYFPARKELGDCIALAFQNNDLSFIKFCLDNNKLPKGILQDHIELFYQTFSKGRFDLLDIMVEYELFGFGVNEVEQVNKRLPSGLTPLMEACKNNDAVLAKKLLAMGADPTLTDENGYNALMYAVTYSEQTLTELNTPSELQAEPIEKLKIAKNAIVAALIKDKRLDLNAKNKVGGKTAIQILFEQGITKDKNGITELRGDHGAIEKLIAAGANPVFGKFELSFKVKSLITLSLSVVLTAVTNQAKNYIGLGFIGNILFNPVFRVVDFALDGIIAYRAYLDAKNPLYQLCRTFLNTEYADDTLINMDKKVMIGAFHINWYGKVISGDNLKSYISTHVGYRNTDRAYYNIKDIPLASSEPSDIKMSQESQRDMAEILFNRYYRLQESLRNNWMAPWTREALEKLSEEVKQAYLQAKFGYKIAGGFDEKLKQMVTPNNHKKLLEEIFGSQMQRDLFYKIHSLVKLGALSVDIETRYNLEKFEQYLHNLSVNEQSFFGKAMENTGKKELEDSNITFAEFAGFCESLAVESIEFDTALKIIEHEFAKDLKNDREQRTLIELISDVGSGLMHGAIDTGVNSIAYIAGCSRGKVYHCLSEGLSSVGAAGNAALHAGFREFYDSYYFLPTAIAAGGAYALYNWPRETWNVCKFTFNATSMLLAIAYTGIVCALNVLSNVYKFTVESIHIIYESFSDLSKYDSKKPVTGFTKKIQEELSVVGAHVAVAA